MELSKTKLKIIFGLCCLWWPFFVCFFETQSQNAALAGLGTHKYTYQAGLELLDISLLLPPE